MNRASLVVLAHGLVLLVSACEKQEKPSSTSTSSAAASGARATATSEVRPMPGTTTAAETAAVATLAVSWKGVGLSTPESILYDDVADDYLVSNIEGDSTAADGKAFISKLSPDGTVANLKWIESGKNKVTLNAPKGMALANNLLYVADLDTVRLFDRKSGAPAGEVKIPGATFLNDVTAAPDGRVIVSDTGLKAGAKGSESAGTDAIYAIDKDRKVTTIAKAKDLGGPNGVVVHGAKIWVASLGSGEVYSLDAKGKKGDVQKLPRGSLDGIVFIGDEELVSSWDAKAIYRGKPGGELKPVIEDVKSPADIGYDTKRGRVLVPLFTESEVRAYELR